MAGRATTDVVLGIGNGVNGGSGTVRERGWRGRVEAAVIQQQEHLSSDQLERVVHLTDHGEPAEGLLALAWIVYERNTATPASVREHVGDLAGDLVEEGLWPPDWRSEQTDDDT